MKQKTTRLWGLILASTMAATALAQWQGPQPGRLGVGLQQKAATAAAMAVRGSVSELTDVMITAQDAVAASTLLQSYGYRTVVLSDRLVAATVPAAQLETLLDLPHIIKVQAPRRFRPLLDKARTSVKTNAVHLGTGFDSPYTGKGVLVGIIDQGFDYAHATLRDAMGKSRAKFVREYIDNQVVYSHTISDSIIAQKNDNHDHPHGTHVTGIAAGTRLNSSGTDLTPYYGLAYNADLALVASGFQDAEILDGVKTIKEFAEQNGQPWVVNMSFGQQGGPHDGSTDYDQALSSYVGNGGFLVGAMGNEGDKPLHLAHMFTAAHEKLGSSIEIETDYDGKHTQDYTYVSIWLDRGTAYNDIEIRPRLIDSYDGQFVTAADAAKFWDNKLEVYVDSATNNGKINIVVVIEHDKVFTRRYSNADQYRVVLEFTSKRPGTGFHAWLESNALGWSHSDEPSLVNGDAHYQVAEGAASSEKVVAVGAYTSKTEWTSLNGLKDTDTSQGSLDSLAIFSSVGPQLDNNLPKPTVAAPGCWVASAISSVHASFDAGGTEADTHTLQKLSLHGRDNYYANQPGTSMAAPMVTGAIAIWLEAYPTMPYATLMDIFKRSSTRDTYTGSDEWTPNWGYGKLNVYEGLKLALEAKKKETTGIYHVANTATPITFQAEPSRYRLLFGSNESQANIALYTTAGALVSSQQLSGVTMGQEAIVNLSGLGKGVYILRVKTAEASYVRKITVD
ncbi:MAG: S8 family peptidase [Bacteroidales bacterium]|nr:S8 family peptidase [Bacteroidales bacterium]